MCFQDFFEFIENAWALRVVSRGLRTIPFKLNRNAVAPSMVPRGPKRFL